MGSEEARLLHLEGMGLRPVIGLDGFGQKSIRLGLPPVLAPQPRGLRHHSREQV